MGRRFNGKPVVPGVFVYVFEVEINGIGPRVYAGDVTVIKKRAVLSAPFLDYVILLSVFLDQFAVIFAISCFDGIHIYG